MIAPGAAEESVEHALDSARELLGMEVAYVAEVRDGWLHYRRAAGDSDSFGILAGQSRPLAGTYSEALLDERLPNVVRDTSLDPVTGGLEITERYAIGAYVGVPLNKPDGTLYGTFGCLSHAPSTSLEPRSVRVMHVYAHLIAERLVREQRKREEWQLAAASGSAYALLAGLAARDGYTEAHSQAVVQLALAIGARLGVGGVQLTNLHWVALLHDIGKLGVPDAILNKPGALTDDERLELRRHADVGERIIAATPELAHLATSIRAGRERWDGTGYPDGLAGREIPLISRIVCVSDAYHAMTSARSYRAALAPDEAIAEIERNAGTQFCPSVTAAAVAVLSGR